jgi:hypothetical protein
MDDRATSHMKTCASEICLLYMIFCTYYRKLELTSKQSSKKDELVERKRRLVDFGVYLSRHSNGYVFSKNNRELYSACIIP